MKRVLKPNIDKADIDYLLLFGTKAKRSLVRKNK